MLRGGPASLCVVEGNGRARSFYARNRFRPDGDRRAVPEWDALPFVRLVR